MARLSSNQAYRRKAIRESVSALRSGYQRRYPEPLRTKIVDYARERVAAGFSLGRVSSETGVSRPTLVRLLKETERQLRRVRVVTPTAAKSESKFSTREPEARQLLLRGPGGVVVEGLDIDGAAALLKALT